MPTKNLLAIIGATGNQGLSTANFVLDSPALSARYEVRALSRTLSSPAMRALAAKGASLAYANMSVPASLPAALAGVHTLYFMTATQYSSNMRAIETAEAHAVCAAAVAAGVEYIIFSSMSHPQVLSGGALTHVEHFDVKAEIEAHIRTLPVRSAFVAPGCFMQNLQTTLRPRRAQDGDGWVLMNCARGDTVMPWIDVTDTGKWVGAILADPDKYSGKFFAAAAELRTFDQVVAIMSRVTGQDVKYVQVPDDVYKGFLPAHMREQVYEMWVLSREYGYYGSEMGKLVEWAKEQADGEVTGLEAFLTREGYTLE